MHEARVVADLVDKITEVAKENGTDHVDAVLVQLGAMSHLTEESFLGQFEVFAAGTPAENATLDITRADDPFSPAAKDVRLVSVVTSVELDSEQQK